jgi:hypothetical protein
VGEGQWLGGGNSETCLKAAESGLFEILKWANENGYTWDSELYVKAAYKHCCAYMLAPMQLEMVSLM